MDFPVKVCDDVFLLKSSNPFINNTYLIKNEIGVLIDPHNDSALKEKLQKIIEFDNIKYVIFQDVDASTLKSIENLREFLKDFKILVHWKNLPFIKKHYDNVEAIEEDSFAIDLKDEKIKFIFSPFNIGAGSLCTLYKKAVFTNTLLSSIKHPKKIFGDNNKKYLSAIDLFHKLYYPKKYLLKNLKKLPKHFDYYFPKYGFMLERDMFLEVKQILQSQNIDEIKDEMILSFYENLFLDNFSESLKELFNTFKDMFPTLKGIEFHIKNKIFTFGKKTNYKSEIKSDGEIILFFENDLKISPDIKEFFKNILNTVTKAYVIIKKREESVIDSLTGLFNTGYLKFLKPKLKQSIRYNFSITFAKISVKFLEDISLLYKDCIIKDIAKFLQKHFRSSDILIRENNSFLIIMPFTSYDALENKLQYLKNLLKKSEFCGNKKYKVDIDVQMLEYDKKSELEEVLKELDLKEELKTF